MRNRFDENGPDIKVVVAQYRDTVRNRLRWIGPAAGGIVLLALVLTGLYSVEPGEVGVVRTFGAKNPVLTKPGLHFAVPIAQKVDVINVEKIRRVEIGFRSGEAGTTRRVDSEALMLTGDENIVEAQLIVQYKIRDPDKWLFKLQDPAASLHTAAEVALRGVVGQTTITSEDGDDDEATETPEADAKKKNANDAGKPKKVAAPDPVDDGPIDILTTGREEAQRRTEIQLQMLMDLYESGIEILEVKLQTVDAPDEVKDAFHEVVRAREKREQMINEAKGYREDKLPRARGEAKKIERAAEAYKRERVIRAEAEAAKFLAVLAEYVKAKSVTRERLHLETMERILARVNKKVFVDDAIGDRALPLLPLGGKGFGTVGGGQ